ncbi:MAG TPA: hypothetical protein VHE30_23035 [Polyangiaceae bacterium]|nr:hypothetical protein [Polyangiaceae bacterium]
MPKAFDTWQVFPHRPLERLTENLWRVEGDLPGGQGTRVMTIAKLADGRLVVHNAIALEEDLMKEIDAFGTVSAIVVPNGFHRLDSKVYKQRYPNAKVYCPASTTKKVAQVVPVDGSYADVPHDDSVKCYHLDGTKDGEGVLEVKSSSGTTLTFNDAICNLPKLSGFVGFFLAPTGEASVPRFTRWMIAKDKQAFRGHLERLAKTENLSRIIVSHGKMITDAPGAELGRIASAL